MFQQNSKDTVRMDPITGVAALTGLTVAALAGLRLKKQREGFEDQTETTGRKAAEVLPSVTEENNYPESINESQSRYNPLMSMINPAINPIIPVGASPAVIQQKQKTIDSALGNLFTPYDPTSPEAFKLKDMLNRYKVRSDAKGGLYNAINFCRKSASENAAPFTQYRRDTGNNIENDTNGNPIVSKQGSQEVINENETLKFDEVCGVCLTSGVDEDGKPFTGRRGMLVDPSAVQGALKEQRDFSYPFPRVSPSLGKCEGSPNEPAFAINEETLKIYTSRIDCQRKKEVGNNCGLCYENDTYTYVDDKVLRNTVSLILMGLGVCKITASGREVKTGITLSNQTPVSIPLILNQQVWTFNSATRRWNLETRVSPILEGDQFIVEVTKDPRQPEEIPIVYGYLGSINPNGGKFALPLNLIVNVDLASNTAPNKTGGFYQFAENGIEVARIRPGQNGERIQLQGEIPFTFVQSSEFSALDCPAAPFQTKAKSLSRIATDQPCYAKGSRAGFYNDDCLRERILDAGCTNGGDLFKNPKLLNSRITDFANQTVNTGDPQSLTQITATLKDIAANDLMDAAKTKLCSGRVISSPCEFFMKYPSLKMERVLNGTDRANASRAPAAKSCLSYLYNNKGASAGDGGIGATYAGMTLYQNISENKDKLYCLPEGQLNPDRSDASLMELARIYDMGYRAAVGVEGVKKYLTEHLEMAIDERRNANTDVERKAAIRKCFGTNINPLTLPFAGLLNPRVEPDPPFYRIRDPSMRQWKLGTNNQIRLNTGTSIEVNFVARPDVFNSGRSRIGLFINGDPSRAIRHSGLVIFATPFIANNYDFAWYPIRSDSNSVVFFNDFNNGMLLGYEPSNDTMLLVPKGDPRIVKWRVEPYPTNFVKDDPALLAAPKPEDSLPTSFSPIYNKRIGSAQNNGDYRLSFTIVPTTWNPNHWGEVVHFTVSGNDCCTPGDRSPGIWFIPATTRLHVRIGDNLDGNWGADTAAWCNINQANSFSIECRGSDVTITLNSEVIRLRQPSRRAAGLCQVWSSTRFYPAALASISNFRFVALN